MNIAAACGGGGGGGGGSQGPGASSEGASGAATASGEQAAEGALFVALLIGAAAAIGAAVAVSAARRRSGRCRGNPFHEQQEPMSCVLASSRMIIEQMTGARIDEKTLRDEAQADGWYDPLNGSDPWQIPGLLAAHGVDGAHAENNLSLDDIADATSGGQPVMVGLKDPGHRIVVDGVRTNPDGSRTVLVRDPGYADGCRTMSKADFLKRYNTSAPVIRFD